MYISALESLNKVKTINGTNDKIAEIAKNKDNAFLKDILKFAYDVSFSTGIGNKKLSDAVGFEYKELPDIRTAMEYIKENNTGSDEAVSNIKFFIESHHSEFHEVLKEIFMQDLKIGINEKGISKAIPGLVEKFEPMLATNFTKCEKMLIDKKKKLFITTKLDGNRVLFFNSAGGEKKMFSRTGIQLEGMGSFIEKLDLPVGYVLDGEILAEGGETSAEKYKLTSEIMRKKGEKKDITFHIFDIVPISEFKKGKSSKTYEERRAMLDTISVHDNQFQQVVKVLGVFDAGDSSIIDLLDSVVNKGEEGLMGNVADAQYECKRSKSIVKFKKFNEVDLRCIDILEGQGDCIGTLGSIVVDYKGTNVKVGSGFSEGLREAIWKNPSIIKGKIVTVKYFEETGDGSLRFPVFKDIRTDKFAPSYN